MNVNPYEVDAAARYDKALRLSQKRYPPPTGVVAPRPTTHWPEENVTLLREYQRWLLDGGASHNCTLNISIPTAGHVLGLSLKPHGELCLVRDFERALAYIAARRMSAVWTTNCRRALNRFRRYLQLRRGEITFSPYPRFNLDRYIGGLPAWLSEHLDHLRILRQANWRTTRFHQALISFWRTHTQLWRWLYENNIVSAEEGPESVRLIRRRHLYAFIDARLTDGMGTKTINLEVRTFQATLRFLQEHDIPVPQSVLAMRGLKEKDRLPRFLTDEGVGKLRDYFEERVQTVHSPARSRDAHLDRAMFYLMWQAGLRLGEVEDLEIEDVNLEQRQIRVKAGKGIAERIVYLTDNARAALESYLKRRGQALANHAHFFFIYRFKRADRRMIGKRLAAAGKKVGVKVTPHRLRHTFATQLVNAGCPITTIQRLMGHSRLTSTMVYARVHDKTVAEDYFTAMAAIEGGVTGQNDGATNESPLDWLARLVTDKLTPEQEEALTKLSAFLVETGASTEAARSTTGLHPPDREVDH